MTTETKKKPRPKPVRQSPGAEAWDEPMNARPDQTARTKISGDDLAPKDVRVLAVNVYWYWLGLTSDCPAAHLDAGGVKFPKMEEMREPDPARPGQTLRRPVIGKLQRLREDQFRAIVEETPRLMIRPLTGQNQKGTVTGKGISMPTKKQTAEALRLGRPLPGYVAQKGDEPALRFMFAVLCPDQDNPTRGHHYPPSLEEIGLEWPDELEP